MGRAQKIQLEEFWEEHPQTRKLRCKVCAARDIAHTRMAHNSRKGHETSADHLGYMKAKETAEVKQRHERTELEKAMHGVPAVLTMTEETQQTNLNMEFGAFMDPSYGYSSPDEENQPHHRGNSIGDEIEWLIQYFDDLSESEDGFSSNVEESEDEDISKTTEDFQASRIQATLSKWDQHHSNWFPYPNKTVHNLPRLRLSKSHLTFLFWVMKQLGVQDVPSVDQLRNMQQKLRDNHGGITTRRFQSDLGNIFYVNELAELVSKDYSNPQTASLLEFYPEEVTVNSSFSEIWQGRKIREMDPDLLTPMVRKGMKDYYVKEVAELKDGRLIIPI
ncbi:hypothetical protein M422DRAFT_262598 [Sphaerobolus stellatus SS14]|uniref:Unplaced genomic scaffold SPHSTscaffold_116, whole genome shotgun sequence n=1 Tax=Sphaerobolus stellatus (strain SS14) TaxID=990650 RepID=A0A0C9VCV7_SPHS4|nr:hypothetical protein M422DRAFT_262598 [Sphaerobolus stellatus SS14]